MERTIPRLGMALEPPRLTDAGKWSEWFWFCENVLREPEFYVARAPARAAMIRARKSGDLIRQTDILAEFSAANQNFHLAVIRGVFQNPIVQKKLDGGTVVYLCAGIDFCLDMAHYIGPKGQLFLIDHAASIIKHLRREVIEKNNFPGTAPRVFKALEMSAEMIGSMEAISEGLGPAETVDVIIAIRGMHRVEPSRREKALAVAQSLLKPGGIIVLIELFENYRPPNRIPTPGAWYWRVSQYQEHLPGLELVQNRGKGLKNQDDLCRMLLFQKPIC